MNSTRKRYPAGVIASLLLVPVLFSPGPPPNHLSQQEVRGNLAEHVIREERMFLDQDSAFGVGLHENRGLIMFNDGEVAAVHTIHTFEHRPIVKSTHAGFRRFTFEDGSIQVIRFQGTSELDEEGRFTYGGEYEYVQGSGRFEGIQGGGTYSGIDDINKHVGSYTLP